MESKKKLVYRFRDASVPPAFHRSYTISITDTQVEFSVDVYGEILSNEVFQLKQADFNSFLQQLLALDIRQWAESNDPPPVGGKSDLLEIEIEGHEKVEGIRYYYGVDKMAGNLEGDVAAAVALFKTLVPNFKKRLR